MTRRATGAAVTDKSDRSAAGRIELEAADIHAKSDHPRASDQAQAEQAENEAWSPARWRERMRRIIPVAAGDAAQSCGGDVREHESSPPGQATPASDSLDVIAARAAWLLRWVEVAWTAWEAPDGGALRCDDAADDWAEVDALITGCNRAGHTRANR
jgi:hypothetical protein